MAKKKEPILEVTSEVDFEYEDPRWNEISSERDVFACTFELKRYSDGVINLQIRDGEKGSLPQSELDIYLTQENLKQLIQTIRPLLKNDL